MELYVGTAPMGSFDVKGVVDRRDEVEIELAVGDLPDAERRALRLHYLEAIPLFVIGSRHASGDGGAAARTAKRAP